MNAKKLFDHLLVLLDVKNDRRLANLLEVTPATISKTRSGHLKVGAPTLIRIHELTSIPIYKLKELAGIPPYIPLLDRACILLDD